MDDYTPAETTRAGKVWQPLAIEFNSVSISGGFNGRRQERMIIDIKTVPHAGDKAVFFTLKNMPHGGTVWLRVAAKRRVGFQQFRC